MTNSTDRPVPDPQVRPTLAVDEAAHFLGMSRSGVYAAIRSGTFPADVIHIGGRVLVSTASLRRVLGLDVPAEVA